MYCYKCLKKIDGESKLRNRNDKLEWYHLECYPEEAKITETERSLVKTLTSLVKAIAKALSSGSEK